MMVMNIGARFVKGTFSGIKFKRNRNGMFCRKISILLKSSRKNFMTAPHLDKAEKKRSYFLHSINITQRGS